MFSLLAEQLAISILEIRLGCKIDKSKIIFKAVPESGRLTDAEKKAILNSLSN